MEETQFKSKDFSKMIIAKLGGKKNRTLKEEELYNVKQLTLNGYNLAGEKTDINFEDLIYFKALETLILSKVTVQESDIECLNKLKSLKNIQCTKCVVVGGEKFISLDIEKVVIEGKDFGILEAIGKKSAVKTLRIRENRNVDIQKITEFSNIKEVYIQYSDIKNEERFLDLKELEILNLEGSTIEDEKVLENLNMNVRVEFRRV